MKDFSRRWQTAAEAARRAADLPEELPFGLATRVMARFQAAPVETWGDLLAALGLRAVFASAALFLASAALAVWQVDLVSLAPDWIETPFSPRILLP